MGYLAPFQFEFPNLMEIFCRLANWEHGLHLTERLQPVLPSQPL